MNKETFISEQSDIDYIRKSKNSSLAFGLVAIVFIFLHLSDRYTLFFTVTCLMVIALSLLRIHNVNNYFNNKIALPKATKNTSILLIINGLLWSLLGFTAVLSYEQEHIKILITFILLLAFIAGSIVTVSSRKALLITFDLFMFAPITFYCVRAAIKYNSVDALFLIAFNIINILYTLKQASVVNNELRSRFASEFELKKSLEELEQSKKTLQEESVKTFHASRLSSLGEMAGGVAHEINNPLTIIQGVSNILLSKEHNKFDENIITKLQKIHSASERIAKIVKSMKLISSKNDTVEHEYVFADKIVQISIDLFEERIKTEKIQYHYNNQENPRVYCNQLQVAQILINLISNALDALQGMESERYLSLNVESKNDQVLFRVINSGELLSDEIKNRIFEPFFTTKAFGKGTGLGLSISQTLASGNNGQLSYEPYEGKISFVLSLKKPH